MRKQRAERSSTIPARTGQRTPKQRAVAVEVVRQIIGLSPLYPPLPSDLTAIERIKLYAREGFMHRRDGTDEDFERVWEEAFKKESKFKFLVDARREEEKGGKK